MADVQKTKYGLFVPTKSSAKTTLVKKPSIFGDDSDDEEIPSSHQRKPPTSGSAFQAKMKKQTQIEMEKALAEDPTVYDYDQVYDDMVAAKEANDPKKVNKGAADRKPKYIEKLLKAAEVKKKEYERRVERQVQKEREAEGDEFGDKEAFVTSAYRKKMQEIAEAEEKEKRQDRIEEMLDVTKQKDLSGFYRHILKETTGDDPAIKKEKDDEAQETEQDKKTNKDDETSGEKQENPKERTYRKRHSSSDSDSSRDEQNIGRKVRSRSSSSGDDGKRMRSRSRSTDKVKGHHRQRSKSRSHERIAKSRESRKGRESPSRSRGRDDRKLREIDQKKLSSSSASRSKRRHSPEKCSSSSPSSSKRRHSPDGSKGEHKERKDTKSNQDKVAEIVDQKPRDTRPSASVFAKRNTGETISDAKARYLARKIAKQQ